MPLAYWCVLAAALLPLAFVFYAKSGGSSRDNHAPRDAALALTGPRRRAYAAHQNGYENFPFFAAAVIIAITSGAAQSTVGMLALAYVILRIAHGLCYIADAATLRSLSYVASTALTIAIFVLPAF